MLNAEDILKNPIHSISKYNYYMYFGIGNNAYLMFSSYESMGFVEFDSDKTIDQKRISIVPRTYFGASTYSGDYILYQYSDGAWSDITGEQADHGFPVTDYGVDHETFQDPDWLYSNSTVSLYSVTSSNESTTIKTYSVTDLSMIYRPAGMKMGASGPRSSSSAFDKTVFGLGFANTLSPQKWDTNIKVGDKILFCLFDNEGIEYFADSTNTVRLQHELIRSGTSGEFSWWFYKLDVTQAFANVFPTKKILVAYPNGTSSSTASSYAAAFIFDGDVVDSFGDSGVVASTIGSRSYKTGLTRPKATGSYIWAARCNTAVYYNPSIIGELATANNKARLTCESSASSSRVRDAFLYDDTPDKYMESGSTRYFTILRDRYTYSEMLISGVEILYKENNEAYILKSDETYYTIQNGSVVRLSATSLTSDYIMENGFTEIPDWNVIKNLVDPILYFHNKNGDHVKQLHMEMVATPKYAFVETEDIYVEETAVEHLTGFQVDASSDCMVTYSVDHGDTWFYVNDDYEKVELDDKNTRVGNLPSEMNSVYPYFKNLVNGFSIRFRVLINSSSSYARDAKVIINGGLSAS